MIEHAYAVIMAGGGGTRLWPLSRRAHPKQTLTFGRPRTLFQMAVDRLEGLLPSDHILVVTVEEQAKMLAEQVPAIPAENYLIEPMPRGTASVAGLAALALQQRDPNATMIVLAADHFIENMTCFQAVVRAGVAAAQTGHLVTLGVTPTFPSTGYGYIQYGVKMGDFEGQPVFHVLKFKEKPGLAQAEAFLASGDHAWNSGMFIWTVATIRSELEKSMPDLAGKLDQIRLSWNSPQRQEVINQIWPTLRPETIDFGVMEKADRVAVVPAMELQWNDVGSWESLYDVIPADVEGNIAIGSELISMDAHNNLVLSEGPQKLVAMIGLEDLIVIDTGDALLICPRDQAQKVRLVVDRLKQEGRSRYL